jgi:hypothetical protein
MLVALIGRGGFVFGQKRGHAFQKTGAAFAPRAGRREKNIEYRYQSQQQYPAEDDDRDDFDNIHLIRGRQKVESVLSRPMLTRGDEWSARLQHADVYS